MGKMADFVNFEAVDDNDNYDNISEDEVNESVSDVEFVDDENIFDENLKTYYATTNVKRSFEDAMQDSFIDFDYSQEANNYYPDDYVPSDDIIDEFKDSAKKVEYFKSTLLIPHSPENKDSFYYALLFAIHYQLKNKKDECQVDELKKDKVNDQIYDAIFPA